VHGIDWMLCHPTEASDKRARLTLVPSKFMVERHS
jgi:hypothetical protein